LRVVRSLLPAVAVVFFGLSGAGDASLPGAAEECAWFLTQGRATPVPDREWVLAKSGCCSHHGGVCGCQGGRDVCCDGQFSPTCGC